jgi:hypothetical protein
MRRSTTRCPRPARAWAAWLLALACAAGAPGCATAPASAGPPRADPEAQPPPEASSRPANPPGSELEEEDAEAAMLAEAAAEEPLEPIASGSSIRALRPAEAPIDPIGAGQSSVRAAPGGLLAASPGEWLESAWCVLVRDAEALRAGRDVSRSQGAGDPRESLRVALLEKAARQRAGVEARLGASRVAKTSAMCLLSDPPALERLARSVVGPAPRWPGAGVDDLARHGQGLGALEELLGALTGPSRDR